MLQALSPAVQPRALWVVAHHLEVAANMDSTWMNLFRALADALTGNEELISSRRHASFSLPATLSLDMKPIKANLTCVTDECQLPCTYCQVKKERWQAIIVFLAY